MATAYASAIAHAGVIGTASPFWYSIAGDATVVPYPGAGDPAVASGLRARGIAVVPPVTETDGLRAFDAVLASTHRRTAMVRALVSIARNPAYTGLDLDLEQFALDRVHAAAPADAAAAGYAPTPPRRPTPRRPVTRPSSGRSAGTAPGPVATYAWGQQVATYARSISGPRAARTRPCGL